MCEGMEQAAGPSDGPSTKQQAEQAPRNGAARRQTRRRREIGARNTVGIGGRCERKWEQAMRQHTRDGGDLGEDVLQILMATDGRTGRVEDSWDWGNGPSKT